MKTATSTLAGLLAASAVLAQEAPRYHRETQSSGIEHRYEGGWEFFVGGGVATFDCDEDGRPDLYLAGGRSPAALFRNSSAVGGALRFARFSSPELEIEHVTGTYPLDIDSDGTLDLAVLRVGENVLFRGLGGCRFERANEAWGFQGGDAWTTAFTARWDKGRDRPTMVFGNYVDRAKPGAPFGTCHDNVLVRPAAANRYSAPEAITPGYCTLSVLFSDWKRNGAQELWVTNDRQYHRGGQDQLWRVPSAGKPLAYTEREGWRKLSIWGMGIATYDVNEDGIPEYFLTSMGDNKLRMLARGSEQPTYEDEAAKRGVTAHRPYTGGDILPSTAWHPEFLDVNNDGYIDLFISKGNVESMTDFARRDPNNLLMGGPSGKFVNVGEEAGIVTYSSARGASLGDFNLDGLPDLVVVNRKENVDVWRNVGRGTAEHPVPMGNWLNVRLLQESPNRDAVGAWIEVRVGTRTLHREVTIGGGHASGLAGWIHFGVGTAERARVRVQWPDGEWGDWANVYTNQFVRVVRGRPGTQVWLPPAAEAAPR
jgi:hypothetical protein